MVLILTTGCWSAPPHVLNWTKSIHVFFQGSFDFSLHTWRKIHALLLSFSFSLGFTHEKKIQFSGIKHSNVSIDWKKKMILAKLLFHSFKNGGCENLKDYKLKERISILITDNNFATLPLLMWLSVRNITQFQFHLGFISVWEALTVCEHKNNTQHNELHSITPEKLFYLHMLRQAGDGQ